MAKQGLDQFRSAVALKAAPKVVWVSGLTPPHEEDVGGDSPDVETYIRLEFTEVLREDMPARDQRFKLSDHPSSKWIHFMEALMAAAGRASHPIAAAGGNPAMLLGMVFCYHDHDVKGGIQWSFPHVDQVFYDKKDPLPSDDDLEEIDTGYGVSSYVIPHKFLPKRAIEKARQAAKANTTANDGRRAASEASDTASDAAVLHAILNNTTCRVVASPVEGGGSGLTGDTLANIVRTQFAQASPAVVEAAVALLPSAPADFSLKDAQKALEADA